MVFFSFAGFSYISLPFIATSNEKATKTSGTFRDTVNQPDQSDKDAYYAMGFTFFDTLTKMGRQIPNPLKKDQYSSISPLKENTEIETPNSFNNSMFIVQVASFKRKSMAEALKAKLEQKGYSAYIESADIPDKGVWYRVSLGGFQNRESALKLIDKIKLEEKLSGFLKMSKKSGINVSIE